MFFSKIRKNKLALKSSTASSAKEKHVPFNPSRFCSALAENYYPKGWGKGAGLNVEQSDLVDWLRKKYGSDPASMSLADRLEACKTDHRCRSAACPKCASAAQAFTTDVVSKFLAAHPDRKKIVCVSVVPVDGEVAKGKLSAEQQPRDLRRWKEGLARAGVKWFIGATDLSFNEHTDGRYKPSWQEHFYGFTVTDDPSELKKQLKRQFPKTDAIPRPVKVKVWDGKQKAIEYMMKREFWRRIGTDEGQRHEKDTTEKRECRATDKQPLRKAQKHELLLHLDEIGIQGRLLMRYSQFVHLAGSGWNIVDRAPKGRVRGNGPSR
jgi:hypothetical protein